MKRGSEIIGSYLIPLKDSVPVISFMVKRGIPREIDDTRSTKKSSTIKYGL